MERFYEQWESVCNDWIGKMLKNSIIYDAPFKTVDNIHNCTEVIATRSRDGYGIKCTFGGDYETHEHIYPAMVDIDEVYDNCIEILHRVYDIHDELSHDGIYRLQTKRNELEEKFRHWHDGIKVIFNVVSNYNSCVQQLRTIIEELGEDPDSIAYKEMTEEEFEQLMQPKRKRDLLADLEFYAQTASCIGGSQRFFQCVNPPNTPREDESGDEEEPEPSAQRLYYTVSGPAQVSYTRFVPEDGKEE